MKKVMLILVVIGLLVVGTNIAQEEDNSSTLFYFFAACETQAVIDFNGTMEAGFDVYVQIFDQVGGGGQPLTDLIRVPVSGEYEVSVVLPYNGGQTLLLGQFASAVMSIASESNPENTIYTETVDEVLDGCIEPAFGSTDTIGAGSGNTSSTPLVDPVTGDIIAEGEIVGSSGIYTPDGGVLNEIVTFPQEAVVQIGARPSDLNNNQLEGRVSDAGLIFAECDAFQGADPGIIWDTDNVTIFWSWFAATPELAQDHINNANYEVFLSSQYAWRQPFPNVTVSPITEREDGNYYVFYTANLGDGFRPGEYRIDFYVDWDVVIDDGYELFGPDTDNEFFINTCTFDVEINPFGIVTDLNNPTIPLQQ